MSNRPAALLSATSWEPGYEHLVELVHQRDAKAIRHLASLDFALYDETGKELASLPQAAAREERYSVLLGTPARFSTVEAEVTLHYERDRETRGVTLAPKAHVEVDLPAEYQGQRLRRVEAKGLSRLASYVVGRRAGSGDLVLFDHLFRYFM